MKMLDYLHSLYPGVHICLHAGELAPGLVPPEGLRFHIRQAVELGHAQRIGHGVDVMDEDTPARSAQRTGRPPHHGRNQPQLQRRHPRHRGRRSIRSRSTTQCTSPLRSPLTTKASAASTSPTSTSAPPSTTASPTATSSNWRAPAWSTTSCPARTSGPSRMTFALRPAPAKARPSAAPIRPPDAANSSAGSQKASAQWELERRFTEFEAKFQGPAFDRLLHGH